MRARHKERRRAKKGEGEEGDKTATDRMEMEGTQYKSEEGKKDRREYKSLLLFKTTFYDECIQPQRQTNKEPKQKRLNIFLLLSLTEKNKG